MMTAEERFDRYYASGGQGQADDVWRRIRDEFRRVRCVESSYRTPTRREPFGPGGFNRCEKHDGHPGTHRDEWGNKW